MKKLLLLLLLPLLTLSCSDSDDDNVIGLGSEVTDFQTTEKIKQAVLRDKRYDLSTSFREYRKVDLEFENTSLYRETMVSIGYAEDGLEASIKANNQEYINKHTETIASYKRFLSQAKSIYTKPCYTVVFIKTNGGSNELRKGYVNENFEFVDVSLSLNNDNWETKLEQIAKNIKGNEFACRFSEFTTTDVQLEESAPYKSSLFWIERQEGILAEAIERNDQKTIDSYTKSLALIKQNFEFLKSKYTRPLYSVHYLQNPKADRKAYRTSYVNKNFEYIGEF